MSFNDWFAWNHTGIGVTGSARMMSAMEPLTSGTFPNSGAFCRAWGDTQNYYSWDGQFINNVSGEGLLTISSSYDNSSLYGIPPSKAISLRAYFRLAQNRSLIGLGAKIRNNISDANMLAVGTGYRVYLESTSTTTTNFVNIKAGWNTTSTTTLATVPNLVTTLDTSDNIGTLTKRPWFHVRLDVIPVTASFLINGAPQNGVISDIINIYTGSLGDPVSETWTLLSSRTIEHTSGDFTPWSATDAYGIILDVTDPSGTNARSDVCVDRFEIYTSSL